MTTQLGSKLIFATIIKSSSVNRGAYCLQCNLTQRVQFSANSMMVDKKEYDIIYITAISFLQS